MSPLRFAITSMKQVFPYVRILQKQTKERHFWFSGLLLLHFYVATLERRSGINLDYQSLGR